jgi:hypothetical protein
MERRIREACFREVRLLEDFDWEFNAGAIDRVQIEQLATGEFIRRGDNPVVVGQRGVGKSRLVQAVGRQCCVLGYRVRYTTSASRQVGLLTDDASDKLGFGIQTMVSMHDAQNGAGNSARNKASELTSVVDKPEALFDRLRQYPAPESESSRFLVFFG